MFFVFFLILAKSEDPLVNGHKLVFTSSDQFNLSITRIEIVSRNITKIVIKEGTIDNIAYSPWFYLIRSIDIQSQVINSIPDYCFAKSYFLRKVTLHNNIKTIGIRAFNDSLIEEINLENVENFKEFCFAFTTNLRHINLNSAKIFAFGTFYASGITEFTFPDQITQIPNLFASYSTKLTIITANNITTIGQYSFNKCSNLSKLNINFAKISTLQMNCFANTALKSFQFGNGLSSFEDSVFQYTQFEEITISCNVFDIGGLTFAYTPLKKATITTKFTEIGNSLFLGCNHLTEVILPDTVTTIEGGCFSYCYNLEKIDIPNVEKIQAEAFKECRSLLRLNIPKIISIADFAFDGCVNLEITGIQGREDQIFIGAGAFCDCEKVNLSYLSLSMTKYIQPMIRIPKCGTYQYCKGLKSIKVALHFDHSERMFMGCTNLEEVIFTEDSNASVLQRWMFTGCKKLKRVVLSESIASIGEYAFFSTNLETFDLNDVVIVGYRAFQRSKVSKLIINNDFNPHEQFYDCFNLNTIVIGDRVQYFTLKPFLNCNITKFEVQRIDYQYESGVLYDSTKTVIIGVTAQDELFTVPQQITKICVNAFANNAKIKKIILNHWINFVGSEFANIHNLKTFVSNTKSNIVVSDNMFINCSNLETIQLSSKILTIGEYSFYGCKKLPRLDNCQKTAIIGKYAFYGCKSLKHINTNNVLSIGQLAFYKCQSLESFTANECLRFLGYHAYGMSGLKEIIIKSDTELAAEEEVFYNCSNLKKIYYLTNANVELGWVSLSTIEYVYFGKDVNIDTYFFRYLRVGTKFEVDPENPYYETINNVLIDKRLGYARLYSSTDPDIIDLPPGVKNYAGIYILTKSDVSDANPVGYTVMGPTTLKIPSDVRWLRDFNLNIDRYIFTMCYDGDYFFETTIRSLEPIQPLRKFLTKGDYPYPTAFEIPVEYGDCEKWTPVSLLPSSSTSNNVFGLTRKETFMIIVIGIISALLVAFLIYFVIIWRQKCKQKKHNSETSKSNNYVDDLEMPV